MKKYILSLFLTLLLSSFLFAQVEYFVQINPTTCSYTIIDSLPGVKWISGTASYDKINKKYIFHGKDVNLDGYLYSINALNADILYSPQWTDYYGLMEFDNSNGNLYGIHWTTTLANANFVSINASNLTNTAIHSINLNSMTGHVTFDDNNHKFIFIANDSTGTKRLFSIDATTGNVITKPSFNNNMTGIQFDNSTGILYGLKWDSSSQTVYFVSIDAVSGAITNISSIQGVNSNINYSTFDEINHIYTFVWTDNNNGNQNYLYTINATNGLVLSNPAFPTFIIPYNLINFRYDNSTGNLYALHWGPIDEFNGIEEIYNVNSLTIYPNPSNSKFTVKLPIQHRFSLSITDITGRNVYENKNAVGTTTIDASSFSSGVYFIKAINQRTVLIGKLIKE